MRTIFHIDVNSAFLSWSAVKQLKENPDAVDLRTIPSAVGGDVTTRHGIITAKSIPAKKYGVQTGEPVVKALQKCPQLVLVPSSASRSMAIQAQRRHVRAIYGFSVHFISQTPLMPEGQTGAVSPGFSRSSVVATSTRRSFTPSFRTPAISYRKGGAT